jgi:nicotinate phosphoribosyltransferase
MNSMTSLYRQNLSLLTDFYQLTMVYAAWKNGQAAKKIGVFDLYFRNNPFKSGFAVGCGLSSVVDFVESFKITPDDCKYLASLNSSDGKPMFEADFLKFLEAIRLEIDIDAIEEGRIVFANEPMLRVTGPIWQCQLLETPFLNMMNFETLIATKAARVKEAAGSAQVLEFGLRRAQGIDGGLAAARAAYIGGVDATSNILAGKIYGIPLRGTHAIAG